MFKLKEVLKATGAKLINKSKSDLSSGVSTDSRAIKKGDIFFALEGDSFDGHDFVKEAVKKGAKAIVISNDKKEVVKSLIGRNKVSSNILKVKNTTIALGDLAKYYRTKNNIPLVAVTGSAGKTTAKDIIAQVLLNNYDVLKNTGTHNNAIGVPQTIFKVNKTHDICVLELGTNHFGEISYLSNIAQPQIAVVTNIGASHLEFFNDLEGVFEEKRNIIKNLKGPKIVLLNGDDDFLRKIKLPPKFKIFHFGQNKPCEFMASDIRMENNKVSFLFNKKHKICLNTLGRFNVYSALAGIAC
ncbi:MAG: UDP-N-acetylmuramoyl-tripeptide--D-alanyl-D-alanine ligase, partial [Candidatus Omnitrophica bacterium]|nr:UDP-N-acetylmuramoyl-tripeptide--D-alanyl-D-alanine ligase [Candidatus Omnitrophota bacterium]